IEPERPEVDATILTFVAKRSIAAADSVIKNESHCRLSSQLAQAVTAVIALRDCSRSAAEDKLRSPAQSHAGIADTALGVTPCLPTGVSNPTTDPLGTRLGTATISMCHHSEGRSGFAYTLEPGNAYFPCCWLRHQFDIRS